MSDLAEAVARASVGALMDMLAVVEADRKNVKFLTVEVELRNGAPVAARVWIERGCNINRLLTSGGPRP